MTIAAFASIMIPTILVVMKLIFRTVVNKQPNAYDWLRAVMVLPNDISFLGVSYAASSIVRYRAPQGRVLDIESSIAAVLAIITVLVAIMSVSSLVERSLDQDKYLKGSLLAAVNYGASVFMIMSMLLQVARGAA